MKTTEASTLLSIAKKHLNLDTRHSDALDFHDLAVWNIRAALEAAYRAGEQAAKEKS